LKRQAIAEQGRGHNGKLHLQYAERDWLGRGPWPGVSNGSSYEGGTIVLCPPFFAPGQFHLEKIKKDLDNDKSQQKTSTAMIGKAKTLLHELAHLSSLAGQEKGESSPRTAGEHSGCC